MVVSECMEWNSELDQSCSFACFPAMFFQQSQHGVPLATRVTAEFYHPGKHFSLRLYTLLHTTLSLGSRSCCIFCVHGMGFTIPNQYDARGSPRNPLQNSQCGKHAHSMQIKVKRNDTRYRAYLPKQNQSQLNCIGNLSNIAFRVATGNNSKP